MKSLPTLIQVCFQPIKNHSSEDDHAVQRPAGSGQVEELCALITCPGHFTGGGIQGEGHLICKGSTESARSVLSGHPISTAGIQASRAVTGKASVGGI